MHFERGGKEKLGGAARPPAIPGKPEGSGAKDRTTEKMGGWVGGGMWRNALKMASSEVWASPGGKRACSL